MTTSLDSNKSTRFHLSSEDFWWYQRPGGECSESIVGGAVSEASEGEPSESPGGIVASECEELGCCSGESKEDAKTTKQVAATSQYGKDCFRGWPVCLTAWGSLP